MTAPAGDPGGLATTDAIELGDLDRIALEPDVVHDDDALLEAGELDDLEVDEDAAP